jgi:type I restriction enzyme S subunit
MKNWEKVKLSDVLAEHKIKNNGKCEVYSVSVHKGIVNQIEHLGRDFAATDKSKYNLVKPYDIVYTKSPTGDFPYGIIKQNLNKYNVIVSPLYGVFTPKNKYIGYILAVYFESSIKINNYLLPIIKKGAKNTILISNDTFLSKEFYLPNDELEQQKIADCLFSIDELINAQRQKFDELKTHKKGLMQQLFPTQENKI